MSGCPWTESPASHSYTMSSGLAPCFRAESAALRNLASAACLIEGQPALATLRFLQTLEASNAGQTFVMNDLSALLPSLSSRAPSRPQPHRTKL